VQKGRKFVPAFFSIILTDVGELMCQCGKFKILSPPISGITIGCDKVMRKTIILLFFLIYLCEAPAQQWQWGMSVNFPGLESKAQIGGTDDADNLYLSVVESSAGKGAYPTKYHLIKIDRSGSLVWTREITELLFGSIVTDSPS
jgi:hypothetical protein